MIATALSSHGVMERLGDYDILNRVAMGGMAEIFRARRRSEAGFEKDVIIKRILPQYTDDEAFLRMFQDEAIVAAKLNHPNIVQVFDFKSQDGMFYIAMELVEGIDVRRLAQYALKANMPIGQNRALQIALAMARGLGHAHERVMNGVALKVVHRDVSPHNVLVSIDGDVKVMDFGIAKAAARAQKIGTGVIKGKLAYMSPEQASGRDVDHRTDIFATGIVLWELLAGRRLFGASDNEMETLRAVQAGEVPPVKQYCPDVLPEVETILSKFLARDKDARYERMRDAERDLSNALYLLGGPERAPLDAFFQTVVPQDVRDSLRGDTRREVTRELQVATPNATAPTKPLSPGEPLAQRDDDAPTKSDPHAKPTRVSEPATTFSAEKRPLWPFVVGGALTLAAAGAWLVRPAEQKVQVDLTQPPIIAPAQPASLSVAPASEPVKVIEVPRVMTSKKATPAPKAETPRPQGKSQLEMDCPEGAQVFADKKLLGTITSRNREAFPIPSGAHNISVRDASGKVIGGPSRVVVEAGELDKFSCKL